jgi:hypothetical protein
MMQTAVPYYPPGTVRGLIESDLVTPPTRRALRDRLHHRPAAPRFFGLHSFAVIAAACARLIPQPERERPIDLAALLDERLAGGEGDGWRYARMPAGAEMHARGAVGLDQTAQEMFGCGFAQALSPERDAVLHAVQSGRALGEVWREMDPACYFEELLALLVDIYYAQPLALEEIGYVGMADGHGWQAIGLDERDAHEPLARIAQKGAA